LTQKFGDKVKVVGYKWKVPQQIDAELLFAIAFAIVGIISICLIEKFANLTKTDELRSNHEHL